MAWYNDVLKGFALTATGAVAGAPGGRLGSLAGGIYGAVKAGTSSGNLSARQVYQTAIPAGIAGALLYPSAARVNTAAEARAFNFSNEKFSTEEGPYTRKSIGLAAPEQSFLGGAREQLGIVGSEVKGLFSGLWRAPSTLMGGVSTVGEGVGDFFSGGATSAIGAAPAFMSGLWNQAVPQVRDAAGGLLGGATNIIEGATAPAPAGAVIVSPPTSGGNAEAGPTPFMLLIVVGIVVTVLFMRKGA